MTEAVGRIFPGASRTSTGSAFAISDRLVLTARHCVEAHLTEPLWFRLGDEPDRQVEVLRPLPVGEPDGIEPDLALLRLHEPLGEDWTPLPIAEMDDRFHREEVQLLGFPTATHDPDHRRSFGGKVHDVRAWVKGAPAVAIHTYEVAANQDPKGISGGPVQVQLRYLRGDGTRVSGWVAVAAIHWADPVDGYDGPVRGGTVYAVPLPREWPELAGLFVRGIPAGAAGRLPIFEFPAQLASADHFVGRAALLRRLDNVPLRAGPERGAYVHVQGSAGLGKTALAAHVARTRGGALHFFASEGSGADQCLRHLTAELVAQYGLDRSEYPEDLGRSPQTFAQALSAAAKSSPTPVWIVVDGLDHAAPTLGANPLFLPESLPPGVFVLLTSRGQSSEIAVNPPTDLVPLVLRGEDSDQQADLRAYVHDRLSSDPALFAALGSAQIDVAAESIASKSEGNFQFVQYVLADLRAHGGDVSAAELDDLPQGLVGYYETKFWAPMSALARTDPDAWIQLFLPALERLAVAAEPVPAKWIAAGIGEPERTVIVRVLNPWTRFLRVDERPDGKRGWRTVHASFADFLRLQDEVDVPGAHAAVAVPILEALRADPTGAGTWANSDWPATHGYELRHTTAHLEHAGRPDLVHELLALQGHAEGLVHNLWHTAKAAAGQLDGYVSDVERAWRLASAEGPAGIGRRARYALVLSSLDCRIPARLLELATRPAVLPLREALDLVRRQQDPVARARSAALLAPLLAEASPAECDQLVEAEVSVALSLRHDYLRGAALHELAGVLTARTIRPVLWAAESLESEQRADIVRALADGVPAPDLDAARRCAESIHDPTARARALGSLVRPRAAVEGGRPLAELRKIVDRMRQPTAKIEALCELAGLEDPPRKEAAIDKAFNLLGRLDGPTEFAQSVTAVARVCDPSVAAHRLTDVLETAERMDAPTEDHVAVLVALGPLLSDAQRARYIRPLTTRLRSRTGWLADGETRRYLPLLAPYLPSAERAGVLTTYADDLVRTAAGVPRRRSVFPPARSEVPLPHDWARISARAVLAELPEDCLDAALAATDRIEPDENRIGVLALLLPQLRHPGPSAVRLGKEIIRVRRIGDDISRGTALAALVPYLPQEHRAGAAETALASLGPVRAQESYLRTIAALVPHLPPRRGDLVAIEALDRALAVEPAGARKAAYRAELIAALAPCLPDAVIPEAVSHAESLGTEAYSALAALVPRLPAGDERAMLVDRVLADIPDWLAVELPRRLSNMVVALAPHLDGSQSVAALRTLEPTGYPITEDVREERAIAYVRAVVSLANSLPPPVRETALRSAGDLTPPRAAAAIHALAALAPLRQEFGAALARRATEALEIALALDGEARGRALAQLLPHLSGEALVRAVETMLRSCLGTTTLAQIGRMATNAEIERRFLLNCLADSAEAIHDIGGESAALETFRAICEAAAVWP